MLKDVPPADAAPMDLARGIVQRSDPPASADARARFAELAAKAGLTETDLDEAVAAARVDAIGDADDAAADLAVRRSLSVTGFDEPDVTSTAMARSMARSALGTESDENAAKRREMEKVAEARRMARLAPGTNRANEGAKYAGMMPA